MPGEHAQHCVSENLHTHCASCCTSILCLTSNTVLLLLQVHEGVYSPMKIEAVKRDTKMDATSPCGAALPCAPHADACTTKIMKHVHMVPASRSRLGYYRWTTSCAVQLRSGWLDRTCYLLAVCIKRYADSVMFCLWCRISGSPKISAISSVHRKRRLL